MVKFEVYIPKTHVQTLIDALNEKNILTEGGYDRVYATSEVTGHWRPLENAQPFEGEVGQDISITEIKCEFRTSDVLAEIAYDIVRAVHPYEVPIVNRFRIY